MSRPSGINAGLKKNGVPAVTTHIVYKIENKDTTPRNLSSSMVTEVFSIQFLEFDTPDNLLVFNQNN